MKNNLALESFVCIVACIALQLWNSVTDLIEVVALGWLSRIGVSKRERVEERQEKREGD